MRSSPHQKDTSSALGLLLVVALADATSLGGSKLLSAPVRRVAGHLGHVLKHTLKQRIRNRAQEAILKVGLTAAAASLEVQPASSLWQQLGNLGLPLPHLHGRPHFTDASSADDQLHAVLAKQVYLDPSERKGLRVASMQVKSVLALGDFWYAYVGGDLRRGFWYCPAHGGHLILAERGTQIPDAQDLARDACIALG